MIKEHKVAYRVVKYGNIVCNIKITGTCTHTCRHRHRCTYTQSKVYEMVGIYICFTWASKRMTRIASISCSHCKNILCIIFHFLGFWKLRFFSISKVILSHSPKSSQILQSSKFTGYHVKRLFSVCLLLGCDVDSLCQPLFPLIHLSFSPLVGCLQQSHKPCLSFVLSHCSQLLYFRSFSSYLIMSE